jgi:sugar/nucleoside kinase (ribokinase family)
MPELIIVGTIGIDTIKTPFGKFGDVLGGSAVYASYSASFFSEVGIISVKGEDLAITELDFLSKRRVSLEGIKSEGKNFRWSGEYIYDMNEAKTLDTELNSLAKFKPQIPEGYKKAKYLFLGNIDPDIQIEVIDSMDKCDFIMIDTMNFWIQSKRDRLIEAIKKCNMLIINEGEARQLFETPNLVVAAKKALALGIDGVIIKKGEHGAMLFTSGEIFYCPGYPLENVMDPTGCGDSFGGAFIGYYSKHKNMRRALVHAAAIASFNAEGVGLSNMKKISVKDIEKRYAEMHKLVECN